MPIPIYHPGHISELKRMLSFLCLKCLKIRKSKVLVLISFLFIFEWIWIVVVSCDFMDPVVLFQVDNKTDESNALFYYLAEVLMH